MGALIPSLSGVETTRDEVVVWTYQDRRVYSQLGNDFHNEWWFTPQSFRACYEFYIELAREANKARYCRPPIWGWTFKPPYLLNIDMAEPFISEHQLSEGLILLALAVPRSELVYSDYDIWNDIMDAVISGSSVPCGQQHLFNDRFSVFSQVTFSRICPSWILGVWKVCADTGEESSGKVSDANTIRYEMLNFPCGGQT